MKLIFYQDIEEANIRSDKFYKKTLSQFMLPAKPLLGLKEGLSASNQNMEYQDQQQTEEYKLNIIIYQSLQHMKFQTFNSQIINLALQIVRSQSQKRFKMGIKHKLPKQRIQNQGQLRINFIDF
ncbi:unnamed protein product [Paramecium octaurelia]|uniref:Uncharacterized protein n=1 Tax=Paramecium octaurelia TaxID=43137 RepID=A0A8S1S0W3_PAROT|nr:unnamed protein product [Paramecium octaurelia]